MSKIRLHGTSSGYVEIAPAAAAGNNTLTAPSTVGEIIAKDAAGAIGITSMKASNVNVGAAVTITESGIEASGIGITVANINGTQIGGRRNIVINGAMMVAQRGTTSTADGYHTVDRFQMNYGGENETPTQAQVDVTSGTTPYADGFRKSFKVTNGNQTGGAGTGDYLFARTRFEAQDIANCGWNYTSSSSFITLSFYVKSSVAQTFPIRLVTSDGTAQNYSFQYTISSANVWQKVVHTIPGNSNLQFDNNVNLGLTMFWDIFRGTDQTADSFTNNAWAAFSTSSRSKDQTSTWWTTNDATFEITGVQFEVGSQATSFEHRSYDEEVKLCHRYFQTTAQQGYYLGTTTDASQMGVECGNVFGNNGDDNASGIIWFGGKMRTAPTVTLYKRSSTTSGEIEQNGTGRTAAAAEISVKGCGYIAITGGNATAAVPACFGYNCAAEL